MEQWKIGKRALFEQLEKVCNNIEQNLSNELADGDNTIIRKDELENLRSKAKSFETDNKKHAAQGRSEENALLEKDLKIKLLEEDISILKVELRSNRDAATRADKLEAENRLLTEELKKYRNVTSRVENLEERNKKLSMELSNAAIRARDAELSSTDNERSSSFDNGQLSSEGRELNYKKLLNDHKRVKEQWSIQKERADKLAEILREKKAKSRQSEVWNNEQHTSFTNRTDQSNAEVQETGKLRAGSRELEGGNVTLSRNISRSDPGGVVLVAPPSEVLLTSPTKDPQANKTRQCDLDDFEHEKDDYEEANHESPQLPRHVYKSQRVISLEETLCLPMEPHHSSSTQDPESSPSGDRESDIAREPNMETPKMQSSSDPPEFIFARSVGKRKRNEHESHNTPVPKVKVEHTDSSSPIMSGTLHASESLDLDDIGDKVVTPRKRRQVFVPFVEDVENEVENEMNDEMLLDDSMDERNQALTPFTIEQPRRPMITPATKRGRSSVSNPLRQLSTNRILQNTVGTKLPAKRQRKSNAMIRGVEGILEDGESISRPKSPASVGKERIHSTDVLGDLLSSSPPTKRTAYPTPQSAIPELRSVILPPSNLSTEMTMSPFDEGEFSENTPCLPKHRDAQRQDATAKLGKRAAVNDEGRGGSKTVNRPRSGTRKETPKPERRESVSDEEDETVKRPTGRPQAGIMRGISQSLIRASRGGSTTSVELSPKRATKVSRESIRSPTKSTPKVRLGVSMPPTTTKRRSRRGKGQDLDSDDPEQEPYRSRPITMLRLDHFKINPNFNQGYDYAYTEVVRGKDRQCLPGCVREECCGNQFGALAQALYQARENPTNSQKGEEDTLLEEYLGDNKHKIWTMGKQERKEVLAQARKWKVSNTMGKHRSVVPRRSTPPGFWEADFPNTQEDEALKRRQKEVEREKVAERYAEAMRPGGAWLFKDE
ncbi:04cd7cb3-031a-489d-b856-48db05cf3e1b [Sclerotinia trifoliorum]|uniref:04cd7cb3-031a-489d-b856-48db05cf3e1b n=1 Tax=Sclerotinia trifoliorum TaxID=28548 RepID=A0A8H2VUH0_9HELO|nr:04cd7cb3-031a-489d-b856-48db05cf3e1b [Sclerotinia trifoliorum]